MVQITIYTIGSRGDVEPYLALGRGLAGAGHRVRLATHARYAPEAEEAGFEFHVLAGDPRQMVEEEEGRRWMESGRNPVQIMHRLLELAQPIFDDYLKDCEAAFSGTDAVLFSVLGFPGYHLGEAAGVPAIGAYLQPMTRSREMPSLFLQGHAPAFLNLWSHIATEQITWQPVRRRVNRWRRTLGLAPLPLSGLYRPVLQSLPLLYGFSPLVVPPPSDWPPHVNVTGYWTDRSSTDWQLPEGVVRFLSEGPPPVYLGFGSRPERQPQALADLVLTAVHKAGFRAVLLTGWGGLRASDSGGEVLVVDEVPHAWLFPQMAAIVHHGGAGTTGTALQSGVPSIVVPSFADQFFWGEQVAQLGVGLNVPRRRLSVDSLAAAITAATEPGMRDRASALGEKLRAEDGVERAVERLHAIVGA